MPAAPDLKSLVKDLAVNQKRASIDLEAAPWQTRSSLQNMKMEAQERLAKLKEQYFRVVRSNTIGIFVFGDAERVARFCTIADEKAGVVQVNGGYLYDQLTQKVNTSIGASREFGPTQLQGLIEGLRDINKDLGIRTMRMPGIAEIVAPQNPDELKRYIRRLVQNVVGDDLVRMALDQKINEAAVNMEFAGKLFPVAVTGLEREEVAAVASLFTNTVSVEVGTSEDGEVNEDYVLKQLESFRSKLKGKTNNQ